MNERKASVTRTSQHAEVQVVFNLDGKGAGTVQTGIPFLDHMLALFVRHGAFDLEVQCRADEADPGDVMEEVALCLGVALDKALGDRKGILRSGHCCAPVDEHLARAVIEISGHPWLVYRVQTAAQLSAGAGEIERFWRAFVSQARLTLHIEHLYGGDGLPAFEAIFKAAARALSDACRIQGAASPRSAAD